MSHDSFHTINSVYEGVVKEKGSKFLSFAHPVTTHDETKQLLEKYRKDARYRGACHFCYAYKLGNGESRSNDDGEPAGTAGKPILNQITAQQLSNILIVVVRFFGGTLLGTSGLIKAYKDAAKACLQEIKTTEVVLRKPLKISFPYSLQHEIERVTKPLDVLITNKIFYEDITCNIMIRLSEYDVVKPLIEGLHEVKIMQE